MTRSKAHVLGEVLLGSMGSLNLEQEVGADWKNRYELYLVEDTQKTWFLVGGGAGQVGLVEGGEEDCGADWSHVAPPPSC